MYNIKNVALTHPDTANDHNLADINDLLSTDEKTKRQKNSI